MADDFRDLFKNWQPGDEDALRAERGEEGLPETENLSPRMLNEKEVKVMGIWAMQDSQNPNAPPKQTFVMLKDNRGRKAPIFIGAYETLAIQMALEGTTPERPLTWDLLKTMIDRLGARVERVTIDDLWQGTFYAKVTVAEKNGETHDIDARPSDAIALALRMRAPIYMAEDVIETAGREETE